MQHIRQLAAAGLLLTLGTVGAWAQSAPSRASAATFRPAIRIDALADNLYRFQVGALVSVFLVTRDGIIMADPLGRAVAAALEAELNARFPKQPVKYVLHTVHRYERAEGAARFREAEIVGHDMFNRELSAARRVLPRTVRDLDKNADNLLSGDELADSRAEPVLARDDNQDGRVDPQELYLYVSETESHYSSRRLISLGGTSVELVHLPRTDAPEATGIRFVGPRVLFVDHYPGLSATSVGAGFIRSTAAWMRAVDALNVETIVSGDGQLLTHAEVHAERRYLDDLLSGVRAAYDRGQPLAAVLAGAFLDAHAQMPFYAQRQDHIREAYDTLSATRITVFGAPGLRAVGSGGRYCSAYPECAQELLVPGATAGIRVLIRRFTALGELSLERQAAWSRTSLLRDDTWVHRETTASLLVGLSSAPARRLSYGIVGGLSFIRTDSDGVTWKKYVLLAPRENNRVSRHTYSSSWGATAGVDIDMPIGSVFSLVAPLRFLYLVGEPSGSSLVADENAFVVDTTEELRPGRLSVQAGIGLRFVVFRGRD
jgi:hypothetical protein